jgi:hypothetical protein
LDDKSLEKIQRKVLPKVDTERLLAEDRTRDRRRPGPVRFAVPADVTYTLANSGTWQPVAGGRLWRLRIQSPGAKSLNLGITRFDLPKGAKLWIYDPERKQVEGPYTSSHRSRRGSLWTPLIRGNEIVVEVFVPDGVAQPVIEIGRVNQAYKDFGSSGACEIDVICPQGAPWANQVRAVGFYTLNGLATCTGTLLNSTNIGSDGKPKPFFLSANHCGVSSANDDTVVVYWNYQSPECGTHGPGDTTQNQTGSVFRASSAASDFLLLELSVQPDPNFNVFRSGWDATGTRPPSTVGIHHPQGDVKMISFSNSAPYPTNRNPDGVSDPGPIPTGSHWRADWSPNLGVTEPGSSGSCLFETTNKRCIGQLTGGPSSCTATNKWDYYGRLSVSWTGPSAATRLNDWLDPLNTGTLYMDGDPHIKTSDGIHYDFQGAGEFVALRELGGLEIQARQTPVATTFNPGPDPYHGLAVCVSINTAIAARIGNHRVTIQPNISGVPDPSGLQVRVDGVLTSVNANGLTLGPGGRIVKSSAGFEVDFPNGTVMALTPLYWNSQAKWYLNLSVFRAPGMDGVMVAALDRAPPPRIEGIMGTIAPGSWLPALPDGTSLGPMPASLHQRYVDLYHKFGNAWRVTEKTSLFDYASGTSTANFTLPSWPPQSPPCVIPKTPTANPLNPQAAQRLCRAITDKKTQANCVFDVTVTGEPGFAKLYQLSQRLRVGATTTVVEVLGAALAKEPLTLLATVAPRPWASSGRGLPAGAVQFTVDGRKAGAPVKLDAKGRATLKTPRLEAGEHKVAASYLPVAGSPHLPSSSLERIYTVRREK